MGKPAIFLDRDGTINVERNYVHRVEDWEWIPGAIETIRAFNKAHFLVVVISNQAGVARGMYSDADIHRLHAHVDAMLAKHGARIDKYFYCPHHPEFGKDRHCTCRKPLPGLILKAQGALGIDLARSWIVGDKASDIDAGKAAGVRGILVTTGHGEKELSGLNAGELHAADLRAAGELILSRSALS